MQVVGYVWLMFDNGGLFCLIINCDDSVGDDGVVDDYGDW